VLVHVEPGWSMREIAARLEQGGVVRHALPLLVLARWRDIDRQIRVGTYRFQGTLTMNDVLDRLESGTATIQTVTIPEGLRIRDVLTQLADAGFGGRDVFECQVRSPRWQLEMGLPSTGAEGYLFPDTYSFSRSVSPAAILRRMVERYRQHAASLEEERRRAGLSEHEMVTLASMIEKETGLEAERPIISAVFRNRLRSGMMLQSDPTAVYQKPSHRGPITRADLNRDSRYNTYRNDGLPPGPICNPGLASLEAAVRPADVDYLYFVARNDGTHEFSRTLAEHNRAVQRHRRRIGDQ
jgi:UPF0755 protein